MTAALLDWPWLMWAIVLPLSGALVGFVWPRRAATVGLVAALATAVAVALLALQLMAAGARSYVIGGWDAPLGIRLHADGLAVFFLCMMAMVGVGISVYARSYFHGHAQERNFFWPLWLLLWTALNALFLSGDIFNLYVTLELMGIAAAALVALAGDPVALRGALRYLLVSLFGSGLYLLGVALLYHGHATVDIVLLGQRLTPGPAATAALAAMSAGLLLKTALFPLHFWLPPAHASAPSPVSAALSALVVKASFYLLLRLWLDVFGLRMGGLATLFGALGAGALLWGSLQALRQVRLKLLIAYSTVAQLGYLFIAVPIAVAVPGSGWSGAVYFALSHALAKSALFLAAGNIMYHAGHDRILHLHRTARHLPWTMAAFGLAGVTIMGLPPSGGFIAKWLLLEAAFDARQWLWAAILVLGGPLSAAYLFKVVGSTFTRAPRGSRKVGHAVPVTMQAVAFGLALLAVLLGLLAPWPLALLATGTGIAPGAAP